MNCPVEEVQIINWTISSTPLTKQGLNHSPDAFGFEYVEYYQLVRDLIEEYRLLFIDWVAGFDKWDYIIDRWGLFNPPGVGPFDKDPDDDIPFRGFENGRGK